MQYFVKLKLICLTKSLDLDRLALHEEEETKYDILLYSMKKKKYSSSTDGSENTAMISWMSYLADPPKPLSHQSTWHGTYACQFFLTAWCFFLGRLGLGHVAVIFQVIIKSILLN